MKKVNWLKFRNSLLTTDTYCGFYHDGEIDMGDEIEFMEEYKGYFYLNLYSLQKRLITLMLSCSATNNPKIPTDIWKMIWEFVTCVDVDKIRYNRQKTRTFCQLCQRVWFGDCNAPTVTACRESQDMTFTMHGCYDAFDCCTLGFVDGKMQSFCEKAKTLVLITGCSYDDIYYGKLNGKEYASKDVRFLTTGEVEKKYPWKWRGERREICASCVNKMIDMGLVAYHIK